MNHTRKTILGAVSLVAVVWFSGCSSPFDDAPYSNWRDHDPAKWRLSESGATHGQTTLRTRLDGDGQSAAEDKSELMPESGPDAYVRLALDRNPSIRAAQRRVERLGARVPQVTSLDDPMFAISPFGEMAETAAGQVGLMSGVSQKFPYPGKLDTRGRIAQQDVAMALAELQQTRLRIAAETRRSYWSYYFTTRALETTRESRQLLDQFKQIAEAEYRAGNRSQPDVLRASVELSNVDNELIVLEQRQETARSMLNQLMDRPVDAPLPAPAGTEPQRIDVDLDALLFTAAARNPELQKVRERIEQYRRRRELARLNRRPDLTVGATYNLVDDDGIAMSANGDDQWWFTFGINLPIWAEKLDAAEREAFRGLMEGVADLTAERNRVAFGVQEAYLRVEAQQKLAALFRDVIVPQAKQTVEASASGYRAGSVDFLTLMDNWRKLLNFDLMYHRAVADMEQALADLEREVGERVQPGADADVAQPTTKQTSTTTPPQAGEESDR